MHELGIVFHIIRTVEDVAKENHVARIQRVTLQLGEVSGVVESYLQDCWKWAAAKSEILPGAALTVEQIPAMKLYFSTFGFMLLQYVGQTVFKSLNKRRHAVFFSLLRKVIIVVPLTYLLPYAFGMGTDGVFAAEPVSNVIGGSLCFIVMLITVLPELKRMDREDAKTAR